MTFLGLTEHFSGKNGAFKWGDKSIMYKSLETIGGGGGIPYDGFVGRLRPKGVPFSGFSYTQYERVGISLGGTNKLNGVRVPFLSRMVYKKGKGLDLMQSLPI